jgi:arylsulfatase
VHTPVHVIDVMPTCLEVARAMYPAEHDGHRITPVEGVSLLPTLQGRDWSPRRDLCWEHEGQWAIRRGDWKLVSSDGGGRSLYNLAEDRTELHDLAGGDDPRVGELLDGYADWTARAGVMPWNRVGQLALNTGWAGVQGAIRQDHSEPYTCPKSG